MRGRTTGASIDGQGIPWHRRLQAHVALGVSLLVALSLGAALFATTRALTARSMSLATEDLDAARSAFYHLATSRAEATAAQAKLITTLPVFRAHMTDRRLAADAATLDAMADDYRRQLKAEFLVVSDNKGRWTAKPGWPAGETPPAAMRAVLDAAVKGDARHDLIPVRDKLFLIVSEPALFAEEILGTLTVGYVLDDAIARELAVVTHSEVSLFAGNRLSGSSLHPEERELLTHMDEDASVDRGSRSGPSVQQLGEFTFVTGTYSLFPDRALDDTGRLVLMRDWRPTQTSLDALRQQLLRGGLVICALALTIGIVFSGRVTGPLKDIAAAAEDVASGNWTRQVPVRGSAEATTMAKAFNAMVIERRQAEAQRARHQAEVEIQRLKVFKATMTTVQDIVNNFLTSMQVVRFDAEDELPDETLALFDRLIRETSAELQVLANLEVVKEKEMAIGTGIEYPDGRHCSTGLASSPCTPAASQPVIPSSPRAAS